MASSVNAMFRTLPVAVVLILFPQPVRACKCEASFSVCNEVAGSNLVFIGKVESIQPAFLSRWNMTSRSSMALLNEAYADAMAHPSAAALNRLKDAYSRNLAGLSPQEKSRLGNAETITELASMFNAAVDEGMRVRFSVKTLFRHQDDDDDDVPKTANDPKSESDDFEVSTPFGDCGFDFQTGETYLVYASSEEGSDHYFTGSCTRTRRLSEAGDDLAYLFFYKSIPDESARLEGFVTTDASNQLDFDRIHDPEIIKAPVSGAVVELRSAAMSLFARSDRDGKAIFDGLREGEYQISAFAAGYPFPVKLLTGPQQLHIGKRSCVRQFLLVPAPDVRLPQK